MNTRAEQSWSMLDPRPVLLYLPEHDEYIVYWNGIAMTHGQAMCMAMECCNIYPTPEMKNHLRTTFERLYYSGAFGTRAWDKTVESTDVRDLQKVWMKDHLKKVLTDVSPKEVLGWFNYSRARHGHTD